MEIGLAKNIRAFRKQRALTQEQLAEVLGVSTGAVYKWEADLSTPELGPILEMADYSNRNPRTHHTVLILRDTHILII